MSSAVPEGWIEYSMGQLGEVVGGGTPASETPEYWGGNVQWATPTEITNLEGRYISKTNRTLTQEGLNNSSAKILPFCAEFAHVTSVFRSDHHAF